MTNGRLNIDAVLLDNSPVAKHIANCLKCSDHPGIRELCVSFYTLLFVENDSDDQELTFFRERMIRKVQQAISDITLECTRATPQPQMKIAWLI